MATLTTRTPKTTPDASPSRCFPALAPLISYLDSLSGRADLATLDRLLRSLNVTIDDLRLACTFGTRAYRRNTISKSANYELLALCWRSGHCTPIHDHFGVSCAFRVVHGTGTEIRFKPTPSGLTCPVATNPMPPGYVCSAQEEDIHQIANMQAAGQDLVTLHIYSPPISKMRTYRFTTSEGAENCDAYHKPGENNAKPRRSAKRTPAPRTAKKRH